MRHGDIEGPPVMSTSGVGGGYALEYSAPDRVRGVIAALGRTEDVKFSPSNGRLAVVSFLKNQIAVFELCIASPNGKDIIISDVAVFSSRYLNRPHGVDFIDDENIIVANRGGDATIFKLPIVGLWGKCCELTPLGVIRSGDLPHSPGAVSITRKNLALYEVLLCNNFANKVTRHLIEFGETFSLRSSEIVLEKWLDLPDGVSVNGQWIAISSHNSHKVLLYEDIGLLSEQSRPDGILGSVHSPHGLRFTSDGRFILVADAGAPYVHIYSKDESGWRGVRRPLKSLKVLTDEEYVRGREGFHSGGPKGIDIDVCTSVLVTTCEVQPLAFFDLGMVIKTLSPSLGNEVQTSLVGGLDLIEEMNCQKSIELKCELNIQEEFEEQLARMINSRSWRLTAPLRRISTLVNSLVKLISRGRPYGD